MKKEPYTNPLLDQWKETAKKLSPTVEHYVGCEVQHHQCALDRLAEERRKQVGDDVAIRVLRARLESIRAVLERGSSGESAAAPFDLETIGLIEKIVYEVRE